LRLRGNGEDPWPVYALVEGGCIRAYLQARVRQHAKTVREHWLGGAPLEDLIDDAPFAVCRGWDIVHADYLEGGR